MPADHPFLARLQQGPIVGDGGMGTQLYARGISFERSFDHLNLTEPELVKTNHLEYAAAGAEMIETNTFGANRYRLAEHGLERNVRELNRAGAKIAREARELVERPIFLAGSMGPLGSPLAPLGDIGASDARAAGTAPLGGGQFRHLVLPWNMVDKSTSPLQTNLGRVFCDEAVPAGLLFPA